MAAVTIESSAKTSRSIKPSRLFVEQAYLRSFKEYQRLHRQSLAKPEKFWSKQASELTWDKQFRKVCLWKPPLAQWFVGGKLNASVNCLDRHLTSATANKAALLWESESGENVTLTYQQLHREVCRAAHVLTKQGLSAGDRVVIYLPMIPEAIIAMLACARIGVTHNVVFAGFSAEALKERINDSQASLVITADGGFRRGALVSLKANVDQALAGTPTVKSVLVVRRTRQEITLQPGRDFWWHELTREVSDEHKPASFNSEHPLFILYTSGSTGKPKGILHTTAGYLLGALLTSKYVLDMRPTDVYFCTADVGWVTGHTYVLYGPLALGATVVMYEGAPNWPQPDRFWEIIDKYRVTIFYTAPTAIRSFMKWGEEWPRKHRLTSLRLLGTVGEPINPVVWQWFYEKIGKKKCPIVDTWWQTETGSHLITTIPGAAPMKPGAAGLPFFGVDAVIVDDAGQEVPRNCGGNLVLRRPWPSMLRTIYGNSSRYVKTYWSEIKGCYFTGDGARQDEDGYFWIVGRIDDVLNISGHRLGTAEIESALVNHPEVAEAAAVGRPHEVKGEALVVFVTLKEGRLQGPDLAEKLRSHVAQEIGALARPDEVRFMELLPKTRSGKIMRRLLKDLAAGHELRGDVSTLEDSSSLAPLRSAEA
jgi:acetyl-CoA synthetase